MIATNDPIRDQSFQFTLRLIKLKVDVELKEFKLMPHGFLSYNIPIWGMREESQEGIRQGTLWFQELFKTSDPNAKKPLDELNNSKHIMKKGLFCSTESYKDDTHQ